MKYVCSCHEAVAPGPANLLTVDVEEYFHVEGFADVVRRDDWPFHESRVERQTARVLDLLDATRRRATFFVVGWTAQRCPRLVREIVARGHEVGSHGMAHRRIDAQGARAFRRDVRDARAVLEDVLGAKVLGYRAPSFSITARTPWAHRVLAEEGFRYSSSVFPVHHDRYGDPSAPRTRWTVRVDGDRTIEEVPPLTLRVLGQSLPVAGGGYLRLLPACVVSHAIRAMNRAGAPALLYFHPWELDTEQPRLPGTPLNRWRHRVGMGSLETKLRRLLSSHDFRPVGEELGLPPQRIGRQLPVVPIGGDDDADYAARSRDATRGSVTSSAR